MKDYWRSTVDNAFRSKTELLNSSKAPKYVFNIPDFLFKDFV